MHARSFAIPALVASGHSTRFNKKYPPFAAHHVSYLPAVTHTIIAPANARALVKRSIPVKFNHKCSPIKRKDYGRKTGVLFTFVLEEIHDYGNSQLCKFGSPSEEVLTPLRSHMNTIIKNARYARRE